MYTDHSSFSQTAGEMLRRVEESNQFVYVMRHLQKEDYTKIRDWVDAIIEKNPDDDEGETWIECIMGYYVFMLDRKSSNDINCEDAWADETDTRYNGENLKKFCEEVERKFGPGPIFPDIFPLKD